MGPRTSAPAPGDTVRVTEHAVTVAAPPDTVHRLVADVSGWPDLFGPTVHVDVLADAPPEGGEQRLHLWATAHGAVRNWTSVRTLDPVARTVAFRQLVPAPPVASMGGTWRVEPLDDGLSRVVLLHDFRAVADDPEAERLITAAVDRNSAAELDALKRAAEQGAHREELRFSFHDTHTVRAEADEVYAFLERADRWPERLPHVARLDLREEAASDPASDGARTAATVQQMEMATLAPDGSEHITESVRLCFPGRRTIVYKQLRTPPALACHTGRWTVEPAADGTVAVTSAHTVVLDPEGVRALLGTDASPADARARVREALGANSTTTLRHAGRFAERRGQS
ncbi:aromatase/cyclase [Streptomyces sp. rh34]|uniref:aromatase/cyclase n=1 Tax=Streptomyces sp. rh34 TaxID=2034272 RepID=UPI000BF116E0|nr:aromatase/cyclase [Streptomyces sp. rh34]